MGSFIQVYTDGGGIRECRVPDDFKGIGSAPFILRFPGFRKSLLASLVASSTASRTSNIVTITATAHGITTGSTYVGFRFFYPGSPSLAAGWYDSIVSVPDANTITFNAPGTNFSSESVNGAAAYTTLTDVSSIVIPASMVVPDTRLTVFGYRGGDTTAATKAFRLYIGSLNVSTSNCTSSANGAFLNSVTLMDNGKAYGAGGADNIFSVTEYLQNCTLGADLTLTTRMNVNAAGGFMTIPSMELSIS